MRQLRYALIAECVGTFLLTLFGTGVVAAAVVGGAQVGLWQVAAVWGFGVALAIYATAAISGAHLNPAISLAFAVFRRAEFPFTRMFAYWAAQLAGAALAGVAVLAAYGPFVERFEAQRGYTRGMPGSQNSAMIFGQYFPDANIVGVDAAARALVSAPAAAAIEGFGTAILALIIFSLVDKRNAALPNKGLAPFFIGFAVAALISVFAPLTQAGWNPARDFGPRVVAYFAGWGSIAIPGTSGGFWAYIVGPLIGAPIGAAVHEYLLRPGLPRPRPAQSAPSGQSEPAAQSAQSGQSAPADSVRGPASANGNGGLRRGRRGETEAAP